MSDKETRPDLLLRLAKEPGRTPAERGALAVAASLMRQAFAPEPPKPSRAPDYYALSPVWSYRKGDPGTPPLSTAAIVTCAITGKALAGMGGPALAIDPSLLRTTP